MLAVPRCLDAQLIDFRLVAIDMYGGAVWPADTESGIAFGSRLGFADMFGRFLRLGFELDWWTAELMGTDLEVRDAVGGLALWKDTPAAAFRGYLGIAGSLHALDISRKDGSRIEDGESPAAAQLDGVRFGASAFAGAMVRITQTGAIWLVGEYRYTAVADLPYHEVRLGIRLSGSER